MTEQNTDLVNHPPHYTSHPSKIEAIEISELLPFCLGNAWKYVFRAGHKWDDVEDLRKAGWYLQRAYGMPDWLFNCQAPSPSLTVAISRDVDRVCSHEPDSNKRRILRMIGHAAIQNDKVVFQERLQQADTVLQEMINGLEQSSKDGAEEVRTT